MKAANKFAKAAGPKLIQHPLHYPTNIDGGTKTIVFELDHVAPCKRNYPHSGSTGCRFFVRWVETINGGSPKCRLIGTNVLSPSLVPRSFKAPREKVSVVLPYNERWKVYVEETYHPVKSVPETPC